ncbi:MAG: AAA family ATPase [Candidatus Eremiobacterota bacterium]
MRLDKLTLSGFRCFGPEPTVIEFEPDLTVFIGANGTGKTAVMQALARMFGAGGRGRGLQREDFHVGPDDSHEDPRDLQLEALFSFEELKEEDEDHSAVPAVFQGLKLFLRFPTTTGGETRGPELFEAFCRVSQRRSQFFPGSLRGRIRSDVPNGIGRAVGPIGVRDSLSQIALAKGLLRLDSLIPPSSRAIPIAREIGACRFQPAVRPKDAFIPTSPSLGFRRQLPTRHPKYPRGEPDHLRLVARPGHLIALGLEDGSLPFATRGVLGPGHRSASRRSSQPPSPSAPGAPR